MPAIGDMSYGYDTTGVEGYLEEIKGIVLQEASDAVKDISAIKSICESEWEGKARDNFISNLQRDTQHVAEAYQALYYTLTTEINAVQAAMANKDESLIDA